MSKITTVFVYGVIAFSLGWLLYGDYYQKNLIRNNATEISEMQRNIRTRREFINADIDATKTRIRSLENHNEPTIPVDALTRSVVNVTSMMMGSSGSGFIIENRGRRFILTNYHVVRETPSGLITIMGHDRTIFKNVKVVLRLERFDMVVMEVDDPEFNYPVLKVGDPKKLKLGDPVIALGNPLGRTGFAARGVVSATSSVVHQGQLRLEAIRTSMMFAPGYSGGPTVNHAGEVVGISFSYLAHPTTFAYVHANSISIDLVIETINRFLDGRPYEPIFFGLRLRQNFETVREGVERPSGVLFIEGTLPVDATLKLQAGDIITDINGSPIVVMEDIARALMKIYPSDTVRIRVKGGREETITTTLPLEGLYTNPPVLNPGPPLRIAP